MTPRSSGAHRDTFQIGETPRSRGRYAVHVEVVVGRLTDRVAFRPLYQGSALLQYRCRSVLVGRRRVTATSDVHGPSWVETASSVRAVERPEAVLTRRTIGAAQGPFMAESRLMNYWTTDKANSGQRTPQNTTNMARKMATYHLTVVWTNFGKRPKRAPPG